MFLSLQVEDDFIFFLQWFDINSVFSLKILCNFVETDVPTFLYLFKIYLNLEFAILHQT